MPFKRPDTGRFYTDIRERIAGKSTGKRIRVLMPHVKTKAEAREEEHRIALELREGKPIGGTDFEQFVRTHFLPWVKQNKKDYLTDQTKAEALIEFFKGKKLGEISFFNIEQYKRERAQNITIRGTLRSPGTINNELAALSRIMSIALAGGLIKSNPMADVKPLEMDVWRTRCLSLDEEKRLMKHLDRPPYLKPLVRFALLTGMRLGEMLNLEWEHVRLDRSLLYIMNPKWRRDSRRTEGLPILDEACKLLKSLPRTSHLVFPSGSGKKVFSNDLTVTFNRAKEKAKIHNFRFHDLRHTFGTRMAESGIELSRLQRLMGHQDPKMTSRYIHIEVANLRAALKAGSSFLQGKRPAQDPAKLRGVG